MLLINNYPNLKTFFIQQVLNKNFFFRKWTLMSSNSREFGDVYTVGKANANSTKNVLLLKNPQFLPNYYETL